MSIGINDVFTFGKHKGKTFAELMQTPEGPGYCCWLREEKKKSGQPRAFNAEANAVIDEAIRNSRSLRVKYPIWNATDSDLEVMLKDRTIRDQEAAAKEQEALNERKTAYAEEWGAW